MYFLNNNTTFMLRQLIIVIIQVDENFTQVMHLITFLTSHIFLKIISRIFSL